MNPWFAKAVILLDLFGGPSHIDTFDPKPDAPDGIRGEFSPIRTNLPGYTVCELMPMLSQQIHRLAIVRGVNHHIPDHRLRPGECHPHTGPLQSGGKFLGRYRVDRGGTEPEVSDGTVDRLWRRSSRQRGQRAEGR